MEDVIKIIIGILMIMLGVPVGNYLAKFTKEELKSGQKWFKIIIILSLIGAIIGLILGDDILLFSFLFIATVTGRSLRK